jgi:hypothetical protein
MSEQFGLVAEKRLNGIATHRRQRNGKNVK